MVPNMIPLDLLPVRAIASSQPGSWIQSPEMRRDPTRDRRIPHAVTPLRRRRLVDDAAQILRRTILSGRFPGGARLRQTDLAGLLGISRPPIREALVRLR